VGKTVKIITEVKQIGISTAVPLRISNVLDVMVFENLQCIRPLHLTLYIDKKKHLGAVYTL
jgi:hypothetical protein